MKKITLYILLLTFGFSCKKENVETTTLNPVIELFSVYSTSAISAESSVGLSNVLSELEEAGIVWSENENPTVADTKVAFSKIKENKIIALEIEKIVIGKKYFVKAFFIKNNKVFYSESQLSFTHNFSNKWEKLASPEVDNNTYVYSYNTPPVGSNTSINCFAINKFNNNAKSVTFYPNFQEWDVRFYSRDNSIITNFVFDPAIAPIDINENLPAYYIGNGYTKKVNGDKFFLKNFRIEGIDGYTWNPQYPGANIVATGFGIKSTVYVLENSSNGILWSFDPNTIKWEKVNTVPTPKNGRFLTFDLGNRAFVLLEANDMSNKLNDFYEYIPKSNTWEKRAEFPGENRRKGVFFNFNNRAFYGLGQSVSTLRGLKDIWEYNTTNDSWKKVTDYPGSGSINMVAIASGNYAYLGFGNQVFSNATKGEIFNDTFDFWRLKVD